MGSGDACWGSTSEEHQCVDAAAPQETDIYCLLTSPLHEDNDRSSEVKEN